MFIGRHLFGVQTSRSNFQPKMYLLEQLGVEIFRVIVSWRQLEEYEKNNRSLSYLNQLDNLISTMEQGNI